MTCDDGDAMNDKWELRSRRALPASATGVHSDGLGWFVSWTGCAVMGIVNVTPDSFSDGGLFATTERAVEHGRLLAAQGALIVDVGGESTRPGAVEVPISVELERAIPVIEQLAADANALISIDTRHAVVAAAAIEAGASIVNDIGGLRDPQMIETCAVAGVSVVVMHMRGTPSDMQVNPTYADVVSEVTEWLLRQAERSLDAGVASVMIDPGLGFGKNLEHNLALLRALPLSDRFPVLVGGSRKRTVNELFGRIRGANLDSGSIALHLFAAQRGAAMVRVHDVAGHRQALDVDRALRSEPS